MYLSEMKLKNFRCFGEERVIEFNKGLNILVGENDSGKSAIIDAIRIVMGTTDQSWYRVEQTDFHKENKKSEILIRLKFENLEEIEQASFLECLSWDEEGQKPCLYLYWTCKCLRNFNPPRNLTTLTTGADGRGPALPSEAREQLRVTYLRPLRDAYSNMQAGRHSRLSQIVQGITQIDEGVSEYSAGDDVNKLSISGIASLSNYLLAHHHKLQDANRAIQDILNNKMLLNGDSVDTQFTVAGIDDSDDRKLIALLEKLDLTAHNCGVSGKTGLGTSNALSMACELLLNKEIGSSFLLIEEPEAHIHAQRQLRIIKSLEAEADEKHQIIITTHSPLMAAEAKLNNILIVKNKQVFSLKKGKTKLEENDYEFLERYLDATKANLFFAKAVLIAEGPAEELLIPTIARILGKDFTEYGISMVNVRGTGLRRYARIFQRQDEKEQLGIKVACITDRDVMPNCAPGICIDEKYKNQEDWPEVNKGRHWRVEADFSAQAEKEQYMRNILERADGQSVKTFIANKWTFEYDLAYAGLADEMIDAIVQIKYRKKNPEAKKKEIHALYEQYETPEEKAAYLYSFFTKKDVSKAEAAQLLAIQLEEKYKDTPDKLKNKIPQYIIDAIEYIAGELKIDDR